MLLGLSPWKLDTVVLIFGHQNWHCPLMLAADKYAMNISLKDISFGVLNYLFKLLSSLIDFAWNQSGYLLCEDTVPVYSGASCMNYTFDFCRMLRGWDNTWTVCAAGWIFQLPGLSWLRGNCGLKGFVLKEKGTTVVHVNAGWFFKPKTDQISRCPYFASLMFTASSQPDPVWARVAHPAWQVSSLCPLSLSHVSDWRRLAVGNSLSLTPVLLMTCLCLSVQWGCYLVWT